MDSRGFGRTARYYRFERMGADEVQIRERCRHLKERELVAPLVEDADMYEITTWGLAYLRGDLDADYLHRYSVG